jgi:hypothetical protein
MTESGLHAMGVAGVITKFFNPATISEESAEILGWSF